VKEYGRRKPYIFLAGVFSLIGWLTLPFHTVFSALLVISGISAALGTAMSDATIDALAVDVTPPQKRGIMQGISWG
jgi:MFS family permease